MNQTTDALARRRDLNPTAVRLGTDLATDSAAPEMYRDALDAAVALTDGADPKQTVERFYTRWPAVARAMLREVDPTREGAGNTAARWLLSLSMGMTLNLLTNMAAVA